MNFIQEKTLTTKERKGLSSEIFGLPDERKYPLTDESHVRKAVQFFRYCPQNKRTKLAANINKRMSELGITIQVSPESAFYPYMKKDLLKEAYDSESMQRQTNTMENEEARSIFRSLDNEAKRILMNLQKTGELSGLNSFEENMRSYIVGLFQTNHTYGFNPIEVINVIASRLYNDLLDFSHYNEQIQVDGYKMALAVIEDIRCALSNIIKLTNIDVVKFSKVVDIMMNMLKTTPGLRHHIYRIVSELRFQVREDKRCHGEDSVPRERLELVEGILDQTLDYITTIQADRFESVNADQFIQLMMNEASFPLDNFISFLASVKNELKDELYIIPSNPNNNTFGPKFIDYNLSQSTIIREPNIKVIQDCMIALDGKIKMENVGWLDRTISAELDGIDMMIFQTTKEHEHILTGKDITGIYTIFFAVVTDQLYLITKDIYRQGVFYLIRLTHDGEICEGVNNLLCSAEEFNSRHRMKAVLITAKMKTDVENYDLGRDALTEGIHFDSNGNIKFSFKPKRSLMDEYAENHKLLMENFRSNNIEGMKTNLAFHFALINYVERNIIHSKKKIKEEKKAIALKARMFAMNDFKTYMRHVMKLEPAFDFARYYESGNYGNVNFHISNDDIKGVKSLLRTIMMS